MHVGDSVATWDALKQLGFEPDETAWSDVRPGLAYDFGGFKLTAGCMMNLHMREVISFGGVMHTSRTIALVEFEMPRKIESLEQCAAWIAWHLHEQLPRQQKIIPVSKIDLLVFGMRHTETLPWERDRVAYASRPRCSVERTWLKQALNTIKKHLPLEGEDSKIAIAFDGAILSLRGTGWIAPLPGTGVAWPDTYEIKASSFSRFPARLMHEVSEVSIWRESLHLANCVYRGVSIAAKSP